MYSGKHVPLEASPVPAVAEFRGFLGREVFLYEEGDKCGDGGRWKFVVGQA